MKIRRLLRNPQLAILDPSDHQSQEEAMGSISYKDCTYVGDVLDQLRQSGGAIPTGMPKNVLRNPTETIRFGVRLAFKSESYWKSLPKKFTYTLWGYSTVITTRKLLAELREVMLPYKNQV